MEFGGSMDAPIGIKMDQVKVRLCWAASHWMPLFRVATPEWSMKRYRKVKFGSNSDKKYWQILFYLWVGLHTIMIHHV